MARKSERKTKAAISPEAKEKQLINLSMELAEKQLLDGTASASVITHFLKIGSSNYEKQIEALETQSRLYKARADALERDRHDASIAEEALNALKNYKSSND